LRSLIFFSFFIWANLTFSQPDSNYVLDFNGTSDFVDLGSSVGNGIRSIEFWFRNDIYISSATSEPGFSFIVRNDPSNFSEYGMYIKGTDWNGSGDVGKLCFFVTYSGTLHEVKSNQNLWTANAWYHVAGVIDSLSGMRLYINGIPQNDTDPFALLPVPIDSHITRMGAWGDSATRYLNGRIDEISIWNRAISELEIKNRKCDDLFPLTEVGLKAYWKCQEKVGAQIFDSTTNNNNGYVFGPVWTLENYCGDDTTVVINKDIPVIPNVLTSNNDGINDFFSIKNLENETQLKIFNRWGNQIYANDNYQNDWKPTAISAGTYYYLLIFKNGNVYKGFLEILK
jgi:gliding motility-associated-like protein